MYGYSNDPTARKVGGALLKVVGTLVLLYLGALLLIWLVTTFGEVTGLVLFFGGLPVLAIVAIVAMITWDRHHPTASVQAP